MDHLDRPTGQLVWTDELVRKFWDAVGHTHLDDLSFGKLAGPKFLQLVSPQLTPGARICDYGAGSGHFATLLIEAGFAVAVYEPSLERADVLRAKLAGNTRFLGVVDDAAADGGAFDAVILAEVVEHLAEDRLGES